MPLAVEIQRITGGAITYRLQAEEFRLTIGRAPITAKLPGSDPILIDLGQKDTKISVAGYVDDTSGIDGAIVVPNKSQLEDAVEDWYNQTIRVVVTDGTGTVHTYTVKFSSLDLVMSNTRNDRWEYRLQLVGQTRA